MARNDHPAAQIRMSHAAVLIVLAILLLGQPLICLAHCAQMEAWRHAAALRHTVFCGEHGTHEGVASDAAATSFGVDGSVPAYWVMTLVSAALGLGVQALITRSFLPAMHRPPSFVRSPITPPPR